MGLSANRRLPVDTRKLFGSVEVLLSCAYVAIAYAQATTGKRDRPGDLIQYLPSL